jgi:hypothetical protein
MDSGSDNTWLAWENDNKIKGIQDNNWHHLVFVYNAATSAVTLYVDGVANAWKPTWDGHGVINMNPSKVAGLVVGGYGDLSDGALEFGWGRNWGGGIDQFRLYSEALSATEVQALYAGKQ